MKERLYLAVLHKLWISQKYLNIIFENNSDYKMFYDNLKREYFNGLDIRKSQVDFIMESKEKVKVSDVEKKLKQRNVEIIIKWDSNYPEYLNQIPNSPYLFYLRWKIDNWPKLSVVWSRKITSYWINCIEKVVSDVSKYFTIVSWWAAWCDTKAHKVAIENWNKTISVIWTGIDLDYPTYNKKLYDEIVSKWWAVISIFPIWEPWNPYNFPIRNEVVAWLSLWVLVVEAMKKSWTLITANLALDLWKDLFSIPWDITKTSSQWSNMLIKKGMAKLTQCSNDILEEYNISQKNDTKDNNKIIFNDKLEEKIYNLLITENFTIDKLSVKIGVNTSLLTQKLSIMEISWIIKKWIWGKYEVF